MKFKNIIKSFKDSMYVENKDEELTEEQKKKLTTKFIKIYFKINLSKEFNKKEVGEFAEKLFLILLNTKAVFSEEGEFIDSLNPYLDKNAIFGYDLTKKKMLMKGLSKAYIYKIKQEANKDWTITIFPFNKSQKIELYSLVELNTDFWILRDATDFILKNLGWEENEDRFNTIFLDKKPAIERIVRKIFRIEIKVEDRLKYAEMDGFEKFLGADTKSFYDVVRKGKFADKKKLPSKEKLKEIDKWIKEVKGLFDK